MYPGDMTKEEFEEIKTAIKKWKARQATTLTRIKKEAKENNEHIHATLAKLNAVREACPKDGDVLAITYVDTFYSEVELEVVIDKI